MSEIIKSIILNNLNKKLKIVLINDFIYHGFALEADDEFLSIRLDNSNDIKIVKIDIIKEVVIINAN